MSRKRGEFAPHKRGNPYLPGSEQLDMFAPIDTPRYVPMEKVLTPRVLALVNEHESLMRTGGRWSNRLLEIEGELASLTVVTVGRPAYSDEEFAQLPSLVRRLLLLRDPSIDADTYIDELLAEYDRPLGARTAELRELISRSSLANTPRSSIDDDDFDELPPIIQELIHQQDPLSQGRISLLASELAEKLNWFSNENYWIEAAGHSFGQGELEYLSELIRSARPYGYLERSYYLRFQEIVEQSGLDEEEVAEQFRNILYDDDYWTDFYVSDGRGADWIESNEDIEIELSDLETLDMHRDEVEVAIERWKDQYGTDLDIDADDIMQGNTLRADGPTIARDFRWLDALDALDRWAHGEAEAGEDVEDEQEAAERADEAEALAEERRAAAAAHAAEQAEQQRSREAQRILTYVRTGTPWQDRIVYRFADGTYVVELDTFPELREESRHLKHCIGKSRTLGDADGHDWPERFCLHESIRVFSMRPPGYEVMGKRVKRRAPFLTFAVKEYDTERGRLWITDAHGFDNRPPGYTRRPDQPGGAAEFNLDESQKIVEWWVIGMGQRLSDIRASNWSMARRQLLERTFSPAEMSQLAHLDEPSTTQAILDIEIDPAEGAREFFEEGDWPRENPDERHGHVCPDCGFCAEPRFPPVYRMDPPRVP
jgi:hypothetical protein